MSRVIILLLFFISITVHAQVAVIPFEENELVFIKVTINNNEEPLNFVFDTGASTGVLDSNIASKLGVKSNYSQSAQGANGSETYEIAANQTIEVEGVELSGTNLVLVDLQELSERSGRRLDGIIGYDILKRYVTKFDFQSKTISLYNTSDEISELNTYSKLPLQFKSTPIPLVDIEFTFNDGSVEKGSFLFDSGANLTVAFNTPFSRQRKLKDRVGKTITAKARGLNKTSVFTMGSAQKLKLGDYEFSDLPIDISETTTGVSGSSAYDGILGAKIINRFDMILDYKKQLFFHKPNKTYDKPFNFPMSGISIKLQDGKILVTHVIEDSEAYRKGIRENDELLAIDDYDGNDLEIWRKYLRKNKRNMSIKIKHKESGKINQVVILLHRLIKKNNS